MKKLLIFLFFMLGISVAYAQDTSSAVVQKPAKASWQVELNFMPWDTDINKVGIDQLTIKYKVADRLSLRMGVRYSGEKQSKDQEHISDPNYYNVNKYESSQSLLGLMPGIEFHFLKDSRISPYVALEFLYLNKRSSYEKTTYSSSQTMYLEIDGALYEEGLIGSSIMKAYDKDRAYKSLEANIILGTDVYICKNFYAGFEVGFSYGKTKYDAISIHESVYRSYDNKTSVYDREIPKTTTTTTGIFYNNAIRIGVWF